MGKLAHLPGSAALTMARYALLRHTDAPDDPSGCHFDLLLEDGDACRTWHVTIQQAFTRRQSRL